VEWRRIARPSALSTVTGSTASSAVTTVLGIGPPITDGFYYDFGVDEPFTPEDLKAIKKEMERIVRENQRFVS
jgi:threonyl-tRNA synthetase